METQSSQNFNYCRTMPVILMPSPQSPSGSASYRSSLQEYISKMIMLLVALVQLKLQKTNEWPAETEFAIMASPVAMQIYCLAMYFEEKLASTNATAAKIIGYYGTLCGFLTVVFLLLMLHQTIGWINFGVWVLSFFTVTYSSHKQILAMLSQAIGQVSQYIGAFFDRLFSAVMEEAMGNV